MTNFIKIFLIAALGCVFSVNLSAQAKISIQGTLKDAKGAAAADGVQTVTFKLYNVTTAGTALWSETADVNVSGGIYSHYLGSVTPLASTIFGNVLYLGVNIGALELSPRIELTYAPYTFASKTVVCSGALGDVKYSILNPTQFAAQNGDCWIPMDGRSISGSALGAIIGSYIPDGGGLFIRGQEFSTSNGGQDPGRDSNTPIATFEDQATQTHQHGLSGSTGSVGDHQHNIDFRLSDGTDAGNIGDLGGFYPPGNNSNNTQGIMFGASDRIGEGTLHTFGVGQSGGHSHTLSGNTSDNNGFNGPETRPKNLNFWIYIRIN